MKYILCILRNIFYVYFVKILLICCVFVSSLLDLNQRPIDHNKIVFYLYSQLLYQTELKLVLLIIMMFLYCFLVFIFLLMILMVKSKKIDLVLYCM